MKLYAHPFSSYSQKVLIALYENATPFEYRSLEEPSAKTELASLSPLKRFPVLVDEGRTILETTTIIEYLQIHDPGRGRLIRDGDAGRHSSMPIERTKFRPLTSICGRIAPAYWLIPRSRARWTRHGLTAVTFR